MGRRRRQPRRRSLARRPDSALRGLLRCRLRQAHLVLASRPGDHAAVERDTFFGARSRAGCSCPATDVRRARRRASRRVAPTSPDARTRRRHERPVGSGRRRDGKLTSVARISQSASSMTMSVNSSAKRSRTARLALSSITWAITAGGVSVSTYTARSKSHSGPRFQRQRKSYDRRSVHSSPRPLPHANGFCSSFLALLP